jgi:hypothetical protein
MINEDYDAARWWSTYTAEELGHDRLFFKDLKEHGYSEEIILNTPPFKATLAMVNYIENEIARSGALPAVAYSICAEWNCERVSATVVTKAEKQFSPGHVRGSKAHIGIDSKEDHYKIMLDVAHRLLLRNGSEKILIELLVKIMGFFGSYFSELHEASKRAL